MGFFNPVIPTQNFVQSRNTIFFLASHLTGIVSIPNFAPILLYNPESRASNKWNPGSWETYWGPSYINGLEDTWASPNLAPIVLYNPESWAANKGNPGSRETYWGPCYINGLEDTWAGCNAGYEKRSDSWNKTFIVNLKKKYKFQVQVY